MCERHRELLDLYQKQVAHYSAALEAFQLARRTATKPDYDRHYGYVEQSRMKAEQARLNVEEHVSEHGCTLFTAASASTSV